MIAHYKAKEDTLLVEKAEIDKEFKMETDRFFKKVAFIISLVYIFMCA